MRFSDRLVTVGGLNLSGLSLEIANPAQLDTSHVYTIATVSGERSGAFASVTGADTPWTLRYRPDGTVALVYVHGTLLKVR